MWKNVTIDSSSILSTSSTFTSIWQFPWNEKKKLLCFTECDVHVNEISIQISCHTAGYGKIMFSEENLEKTD
jgi:hypothetical protein